MSLERIFFLGVVGWNFGYWTSDQRDLLRGELPKWKGSIQIGGLKECAPVWKSQGRNLETERKISALVFLKKGFSPDFQNYEDHTLPCVFLKKGCTPQNRLKGNKRKSLTKTQDNRRCSGSLGPQPRVWPWCFTLPPSIPAAPSMTAHPPEGADWTQSPSLFWATWRIGCLRGWGWLRTPAGPGVVKFVDQPIETVI